MLSSKVRRLMENARDGLRPDVPPAVWEFYFTKECTQKKKFSIMQQYCRDPTGKTMTVSEVHLKESFTEGLKGYGWKTRNQLQIDNDAFNPLNPKGMKIVEDLIRDNKGEKQDDDHPEDDEDWRLFFVKVREEVTTGTRDADRIETTVSGNVEDTETATKMLAQLQASSSAASARVPAVETAAAKAAAKAVAKAAAKAEKQAKAAAKAAAKVAAGTVQPGGDDRIPAKKRKHIGKGNSVFADRLASVKKRNNSVRAIAGVDSHDILSVKTLDKLIVEMTTLKGKLEGMAAEPVAPTDSAMDLVMAEKDELLGKIEGEESYQKDRIKRIPKAPVAKASPAVPPPSSASPSEPLVQ